MTLLRVGLAVSTVIVGAAILFLRGGGAPEPEIPATPARTTAVPPRDAPELSLEDPDEFRIPRTFSASRRALARQAVQAHGQALGAYFGKDLAAFLRLAEGAFSLYRRADWLSSDLSSFHYLYVSVALQSGRAKIAEEEALRWLERYPEAVRHHEALGRIYFRLDPRRAAPHFETFAARYPGSLLAQWHLAQIYSTLGAKEKALAAVDRCLQLIDFVPGAHPSHPQADKTLEVCLQVTHRFYDYRRLEEIATVILGENPGKAEAMMALGVAARYLGEYDKAEKHLRAFVRTAPRDGPNTQLVRLDLAIVLLKQGRPREAVAELVTLLVDDPHLPKGYFHLGQALVRLGRDELADRMLLRSRKLGPAARELRRETELRGAGQAARADRALALAHRMNGEHRKAEGVFRSALGRNRRATAHRVYLIEHLVETHQVAAARREIEELGRQIGENQADVQGWTARTLAMQGDVEGGVLRLERVCKQRDQLRIWGLDLSRWLLEDLARPDAARTWLEAYLELGPDPRARILLARAAFEQGQSDEAFDLLSKLSSATDEWREESASIWFARCRLRKSMDLNRIGGDLATAREFSDHRPEYHLAVAEWLEAGGDPKLLDAGDTRSAAVLAREARSRADELRRLRDAYSGACRAAATRAGETAAAMLLEAARLLHRMGDREAALRHAGYAVYAKPGHREALRTIHEWYDRPEEIFLRAKIARQLHAVDATFREPSEEELLRVLLGE